MFLSKLIVAAAMLATAAQTLHFGVDAKILRGSVDCGAPSPVFQGSASFSSTKMGSTVRYSCQRGTVLAGASSATCTKFGTWSQGAPTCRIVYTTRNDNTYKNKDSGYKLFSG